MFRASSAPAKSKDKELTDRPLFGQKKSAPRLESAFIFPATERPRGVSIDGGRKSEKPVSAKS
jgi:hypothetical protein